MTVDRSGLLLELCQVVRVVGQVGEDHPLLVVVLAQDLVVAQEEPVADAKPNKINKSINDDKNKYYNLYSYSQF